MMMHVAPPPAPDRPDISTFRALFSMGEDAVGGWRRPGQPARTREESETLILTMCHVARNVVVSPSFLRRFRLEPVSRFPEFLVIKALAAVDPDEFITAVRAAFPYDRDPAARLSPFIHREDIPHA
ncbi:hypothetical protein SAMN05444161_3167 [Rhizobiales bacterium GAS191]|nr:hypothetical protein SAMN05444161_3167 [Rhizobiales bacterium GAS191]